MKHIRTIHHHHRHNYLRFYILIIKYGLELKRIIVIMAWYFKYKRENIHAYKTNTRMHIVEFGWVILSTHCIYIYKFWVWIVRTASVFIIYILFIDWIWIIKVCFLLQENKKRESIVSIIPLKRVEQSISSYQSCIFL